jgi:hypothetical protein
MWSKVRAITKKVIGLFLFIQQKPFLMAGNEKQNYLLLPWSIFMITKSKFWELIQRSLKESDRSQKFMSAIIKRIKETPQNANPDQPA